MDNNYSIKIEHLSKVYKIFDKPTDRVKEALNPFHKRYSRDFYALNDVSLTIKKGETVGIIGKNGAGKSTLLKIITGVLTPSSGTIEVQGRIASLLELGAGFNPEMSGIENVYMNGTIMGYSKEEMDAKIGDIVDFADIGDFVNQPVKMYSSGMFARLAFAVNAFVEPDILIVDEALSVGDMKFQIKCMDKMEELLHGGCTVIFVSHDLNALRRLCQKAFFFDHGQLQAEGEVNAIADMYLEFLDAPKPKREEETTEAPKGGATQPESVEEPEEDKAKAVKFITSNDIAAITGFSLMDAQGNTKDVFDYDEPVKIKVDYEVYDDTLENVVLGVALKNPNGESVCGLNTLLDKVPIPWGKGKQSFSIEYPKGLLAISGKYHFDVALEEKTATIPIHYITCVQEVAIASTYVSEGLYTIPHTWG